MTFPDWSDSECEEERVDWLSKMPLSVATEIMAFVQANTFLSFQTEFVFKLSVLMSMNRAHENVVHGAVAHLPSTGWWQQNGSGPTRTAL